MGATDIFLFKIKSLSILKKVTYQLISTVFPLISASLADVLSDSSSHRCRRGRTGVDSGRIIAYDNAHGYHHRHCFGKVQSIEFESYESIEKRFEAEVRQYLETGEVQP